MDNTTQEIQFKLELAEFMIEYYYRDESNTDYNDPPGSYDDEFHNDLQLIMDSIPSSLK